MKPQKKEIYKLREYLKWLHGLKLGELQGKGKALAGYLGTLMKTPEGFTLIEAKQSSKHVGRVIVDLVLQVGKDYEELVRPAVDGIERFQGAATVSGFMCLLNKRPLKQLTAKFKSEKVKYDLLRVAKFFNDKGIDTFEQLYDWLKLGDKPNDWSKLEERRGKLKTLKRDPNGTVFAVADKGADYLRKLLGHWDAVAVDSNTKVLLDKAGIVSRYSKKYNYNEKRAIVQLAALSLGKRPIDLDTSIYKDSVGNPLRYKSKKATPKFSRGDCKKYIKENPCGAAQVMKQLGVSRSQAYRDMGKAGLTPGEIDKVLGAVYDPKS